MHTTVGKVCLFHHNGDYDGDVEIVDKKDSTKRVVVPFDELKAVVADKVRQELIRQLEGMDDDELLGGD